MSSSKPVEPLAPEPSDGQPSQLALAEALLDAALQAQRAGSLEELVREHPRAARWMVRHHIGLICGSMGLPRNAAALPGAVAMLLPWLVAQLRPDQHGGLDHIEEEAWLQLSSWRPMLAMASHAGLIRVPDFPRRYRRRQGEAVLDNLCGLWDLGPSTVYRTLERARRTMALMLMSPPADVARRLSLRLSAAQAMQGGLGRLGIDEVRAWHRQQAAAAQAARDSCSELWHRLQSGDASGFTLAIRKHVDVLAAEPETDALVARLAALDLTPREQVDLGLARAALARTRNAPERELRAYEAARQVAQLAQDRLLLGIVHSALGKFFEPRDADRAFACYQDSAEFLRDLGPETGDTDALEHFITTYARLAWLYVLRNDERSKAILDRAEALRAVFPVPDDVLGVLEQVWGQYWRRSGDAARALEHRYRALNIFERLGDERSVLAACMNIGFDLAARGEYERATSFSRRILDAARRGGVEPDVLIGAHVNLGAIAFWRGDMDAAIVEYRKALQESQDRDLRLQAFRARYNLAEAHYTRFKAGGDAQDEAAGDEFVRLALAAPESDSSPAAIKSARELKAQVLGDASAAEPNRLLPAEDAVHLEEMSVVHDQRALLAVPADPESHARAHLAIAHAYLAISTKEREAARALIDKHGLQARFTAELAELHQTFNRELTREQQVAAAWKQTAADLVADEHRAGLVARLMREGAVNKSGYAEQCGVSPATASKHLGLLTERGLLVQKGKGPSTRYELPG